jgi:hypothetical protein
VRGVAGDVSHGGVGEVTGLGGALGVSEGCGGVLGGVESWRGNVTGDSLGREGWYVGMYGDDGEG